MINYGSGLKKDFVDLCLEFVYRDYCYWILDRLASVSATLEIRVLLIIILIKRYSLTRVLNSLRCTNILSQKLH